MILPKQCDLNSNIEFPFPILIGDIGGTNARFSCLFAEKENQIFAQQITKYFRNIDQMIEEYIWPMLSEKPKMLVLAIAAPVDKHKIQLTNCHWTIDPKALIKKFGFEKIFLLNDFEAQALATTALKPADFYTIESTDPHKKKQDQRLRKQDAKLILGPGTGLGVTALVSIEGRYSSIPGEGGHIDYAPQSRLDFAIYPYLLGDKPRLSAEELLSGRGLLTIYRAFCHYQKQEILYETPEALSAAAKIGDDTAKKTLIFFIDYLARFSGDLALIFKAEAGVYIGGGIMPNLICFIDHIRFRAFFENKFPHQALLAKIPIHIMLPQSAALIGMNHFMRHRDLFFMNIESRLWRA